MESSCSPSYKGHFNLFFLEVSTTCSKRSADLFLSSSRRMSRLSSSILILSVRSEAAFLSSLTSCLQETLSLLLNQFGFNCSCP